MAVAVAAAVVDLEAGLVVALVAAEEEVEVSVEAEAEGLVVAAVEVLAVGVAALVAAAEIWDQAGSVAAAVVGILGGVALAAHQDEVREVSAGGLPRESKVGSGPGFPDGPAAKGSVPAMHQQVWAAIILEEAMHQVRRDRTSVGEVSARMVD